MLFELYLVGRILFQVLGEDCEGYLLSFSLILFVQLVGSARDTCFQYRLVSCLLFFIGLSEILTYAALARLTTLFDLFFLNLAYLIVIAADVNVQRE